MRSRTQLSTLVAIAAGVALASAVAACHRDTRTASLTAATSAASAVAVHTPIADDDMTRAIAKHLVQDVALHSEHVGVKVEGGIATLTGTVSNLVAKERASQLAATLRGVRAVVDRIEVEPVARTDDQIKSNVTTALQNDHVTRMRDITVTVKDGTVSLAGNAESWPEKGLFTQVTKTVKGVKAVANAIAVKYPLEPSDEQTAAILKRRIANDIWLDGDTLAVDVEGHTVRLKGVVGSVADRNRARADAWLAGVHDVDDGGIVVDWARRDDQRHLLPYVFRADEEVERSIRDAFRLDGRLTMLEPRVEVRDGIAELTGTVDSAVAKRAAVLDAKDTVGVSDVRDLTQVESISNPSDADIDRSVHRTLSEDLMLPDGKGIRTSTSAGKVVLEGRVRSGFERFDAIEDTASVPGVTDVVDKLTLERSPQDMKADIDDRLYWDATVERDQVKTAVTPDGVATLTGTLDSRSEIHAAVLDAELGGATRVVNMMQLGKPPAAGH